VKSKLFASATRVSHCAQWCDWNRWTYLVGETTAKPCCRAALQCSAPEWALRLLPGDCRSTTHTHTQFSWAVPPVRCALSQSLMRI